MFSFFSFLYAFHHFVVHYVYFTRTFLFFFFHSNHQYTRIERTETCTPVWGVCVCMYRKGTLHIISMCMCVWIYSDETHLFFFTEIIFWMHFIGISNTNLITFDKITAILTLFNLKYLIYLDDSGSSDPIFRRPVNNGATVESHYTIFVHFAFCMLLIA